jgi:hypothetical protein
MLFLLFISNDPAHDQAGFSVTIGCLLVTGAIAQGWLAALTILPRRRGEVTTPQASECAESVIDTESVTWLEVSGHQPSGEPSSDRQPK